MKILCSVPNEPLKQQFFKTGSLISALEKNSRQTDKYWVLTGDQCVEKSFTYGQSKPPLDSYDFPRVARLRIVTYQAPP